MLSLGCASPGIAIHSKENMLLASGFKIIEPENAAQHLKLRQLPQGKIGVFMKAKKTFYVMPDLARDQAYVGGPEQFQAYQRIRLDAKLPHEYVETDRIYLDSAMQWGEWGGWGLN